jgi:tRNA (guanine6-N2)-methyltransferase
VIRAHSSRSPRERPSGRPAPARASVRPIRPGHNLYVAQTQPGFESVLWSEIAAREPSARELGRRVIPERAGMTIFSAHRPDALAGLRSAEDVFALAAVRAGLGPQAVALDRIRAAARDTPFIADGLAARVRVTPGVRAGRRIRFRVVARTVGEHEFRRVDFQRAVERGIQERDDHTWRLDESAADVELWASMIGDEFLLAIRLSDDRMRHREYKTAHRPASLRPAAAAALALLSEPAGDDVVLDPFCGAATILTERAHLGRYRMLYCSDRDGEALAAARENVGPRYKPIALESWDARAIPLPDASVTKIVTNLPWGMRYGSHGENRRLYPQWMAEFNRLITNDGLLVMLTAEWRLMNELVQRHAIAPRKILRVTILGASASVYVCTKAGAPPRKALHKSAGGQGRPPHSQI